MNKTIIIFCFLLFSLAALSQTPDSIAVKKLQQMIGQLKIELKNQKSDFSKQLASLNNDIEELRADVETLRATSLQTVDSLEIKIANTQTNITRQIQDVQQTVSKNTLYWIIAVLSIALLSVLLFIWLSKKQQSDKTDIFTQLSQTKQSINEKLVDEFAKITEVLETLSKVSNPPQTTEPDHSLALEVANEITLMERNISHMNQETIGLKPLIRAIERLKDNLIVNGYELVELLGKPCIEGMKITIVGTASDENMDKGIDIITKIIKPQVNYNDKMIQMAQVEVTVGVK